jgi:hypothetical protein
MEGIENGHSYANKLSELSFRRKRSRDVEVGVDDSTYLAYSTL